MRSNYRIHTESSLLYYPASLLLPMFVVLLHASFNGYYDRDAMVRDPAATVCQRSVSVANETRNGRQFATKHTRLGAAGGKTHRSFLF